MKLSVVAISIALTIPGMWAQKYPKKGSHDLTAAAPRSFSLKFRSLQPHSRAAVVPQAAPTPAPGIVQVFVNPSSGVLESAYFIATGPISASSQLTGSITLLDDNSSIDFQQVAVSDITGGADMAAGDFIHLPTISGFGELWFPGAFDYTVQVIPARGASTQADGIFLLGETLGFSDLSNFEPIIASATQTINSGKDVILKLPGFYTSDPVNVVLSDLFANYVVPSTAITASSTEIDVDMSQIKGFDLASLEGLLVTVNQDNVADTIAFRYVPPQTGTFNPAPQ